MTGPACVRIDPTQHARSRSVRGASRWTRIASPEVYRRRAPPFPYPPPISIEARRPKTRRRHGQAHGHAPCVLALIGVCVCVVEIGRLGGASNVERIGTASALFMGAARRRGRRRETPRAAVSLLLRLPAPFCWWLIAPCLFYRRCSRHALVGPGSSPQPPTPPRTQGTFSGAAGVASWDAEQSGAHDDDAALVMMAG